MHVRVLILTRAFISVATCLYIYFKKRLGRYPSSVRVAFSLSLICDSSLMMSNLALIIYTVLLLIYSALVY